MLLLALATAIGLVLIQWGVGRRVLGRLPLADDTWLERALLEIAAGTITTGLVLFGLAAVQLYNPEVLRVLYGVGLLAVLITDGRELLAQCGAGLLALSDQEWSPIERAVLPVIVLFLGLVCFYAGAPTTTWDPLDYHYELPRLWLLHGGFYKIDTLVYAHFPATTELHFGWLMATANDIAANQYTILMLLGMLLAAVTLGVRYCSRQAAVVGLAALVGLPLIFTEQAQGGVIDCALTTFMLLALGRILRWADTRDSRQAWLAALLAGGAVATKHSGWLMGFFVVGVVLAVALRERRWQQGIRQGAMLGCAIFVVGLPWYAKSALFTGNPVWPFADHLFNQTPKGYADILYWSNPNFTRSLTNLITWWWEVTTHTSLTQYRFRLLTPVYLGLMPLLFGLFNKPGAHRTLLLFALLQCGLLLFQAPGEPRYMLTAWALLGMLMAYGAECAGWMSLRSGRVFLALAVLTPLAVTLSLLQIESRDRIPFVMGRETRNESYARRVETWPAIQYVESHLKPGEIVLHGDPRVYLFDDPSIYRIIYPFDYPALPSWSLSAGRLLQRWHVMHVRYVTLSAGAHYMGLTRATLLTAQADTNPVGQDYGVRSTFDNAAPQLLHGHGHWEQAIPLPTTPLGLLSPRVMELGAFTSAELTPIGNPRTDFPADGAPNYLLDVRKLQQRWPETDVQIVLKLNELIANGDLVKVLDDPSCPVYEFHYTPTWGPMGTHLTHEGAVVR